MKKKKSPKDTDNIHNQAAKTKNQEGRHEMITTGELGNAFKKWRPKVIRG